MNHNYYIAVDFDGTCVMHDFPRVGKDVPGAVEVLKRFVNLGAKIILNTMRSDIEGKPYLTEAVSWFLDRNIPLYGINYNPDQAEWTSSPKVYAHLYIDDMACGVPLKTDYLVSDRPFVDWEGVWQEAVKRGFAAEKLTKLDPPKNELGEISKNIREAERHSVHMLSMLTEFLCDNQVEVVIGDDTLYYCYINRETIHDLSEGDGLTPISAMVNGIMSYICQNQESEVAA